MFKFKNKNGDLDNVDITSEALNLLGYKMTGEAGKFAWSGEVASAATIESKKQEVASSWGMQILRQERNALLASSDIKTLVDYPQSVEAKDAWLLYRQKLRDLPSVATPSVDDNGVLLDVTFPIKPVA
jgi:hypothetical protein